MKGKISVLRGGAGSINVVASGREETMEIPWARAAETARGAGAAGLTVDEYRSVKALLSARGLDGTPQYGAWLRTELTKLALRKRCAPAEARPAQMARALPAAA